MKINNRGFAITAVIYGLLILFVVLVSSYLLVLSARKNRIDNLINDVVKEYNKNNVASKYNVVVKITDNAGNTILGGSINDTGQNELEFESNNNVLVLNSINPGNSSEFREIICNGVEANYSYDIITDNIISATIENINSDSVCLVIFG